MAPKLFNFHPSWVYSDEDIGQLLSQREKVIHDSFLVFFDISFTLRKYYVIFSIAQRHDPNGKKDFYELRESVMADAVLLETTRRTLLRNFCEVFPDYVDEFPHGKASFETYYQWLLGFLETLKQMEKSDTGVLDVYDPSSMKVKQMLFVGSLGLVGNEKLEEAVDKILTLSQRADKRLRHWYAESMMNHLELVEMEASYY